MTPSIPESCLGGNTSNDTESFRLSRISRIFMMIRSFCMSRCLPGTGPEQCTSERRLGQDVALASEFRYSRRIMSLNCVEINRVLEELDLAGSFIQNIIQPSYDSIALYTYRN